MGYDLTEEQKQTFKDLGYLIFEPFFSDAEIVELKSAIDDLVEWRKQDASTRRDMKFVFEVPALGELVRHPKTMAIVEDIMGAGFGFHHLHAVRQEAGAGGVNWHQDYEQYPQTNRSHVMVHVFYYLNGLDGQVGDLLVLPRSQNTVADRGAMGIFGQQDLPGSVTVNNVAPGTAVVVHSAVWHARRAKPGGEGRPRYFADASYCQAGVVWPSYPNYAEFLERAEASGLTTGKYAHLFNSEMFYDSSLARQALADHKGSLALQLPGFAGTK